jgi:outer membrane protein assembly factor BamB
MPGIFISYRRDDSAGYAGRLYDALASEFGKRRVFMDVNAIQPGEDFVQLIQERVAACDYLIAVIGRNWLKSVDDKGLPRLQNPEDFVRLEIAHALARGILVIPVLVGGAPMPPAAALPGDLKALSTRNALEIHDELFAESVQRLVNEIRAGVGGHQLDRGSRRFRMAAGTTVVALIGGLALIFGLGGKPPPSQETPAADAVPDLDQLSNTPAKPVKRQIPAKAGQLPAVIDDARSVVQPPGKHDVNGPRSPKLLWAASMSTEGHVFAVAADGTAFVWDDEHHILSALGNGRELWAYEAAEPMRWDLQGFDADGRVWLSGEAWPSGRDVAFCFNSRGEGGEVSHTVPYAIAHPVYGDGSSIESHSDHLATCEGGAVRNQKGKPWTFEIDGNCSDWGVVRDDKGNLYTSRDRGTFYAIAPDGSVRWTYRLDSKIDQPFFLFDDVVFGSRQGLFRLHDGALRWKFSGAYAHPVFDQNGTIYIDADKTLGAVDNAGKLLWQYRSRGSPLALDQKGRLYVTTGYGIACLAD